MRPVKGTDALHMGAQGFSATHVRVQQTLREVQDLPSVKGNVLRRLLQTERKRSGTGGDIVLRVLPLEDIDD